jgi:hypothetical protein
MTSGITRQVAQLEKMALSPAEPVFWVLVPALGDITDDQAIERYRAEHLDERSPIEWIILRGVSPARQMEANR